MNEVTITEQDERALRAALVLLARTQLRGDEVSAYLEATAVIQRLLTAPPPTSE